MTLLEVRNLSKKFPVGERFFFAPPRWLHAVRGVDFSIRPGSVFGFVGESGSGKSTIANLIAGVYPPTEGEILLKGLPVHREKRGHRSVQMVFQDPETSLDPRKTVRFQISEGLMLRGETARERTEKVCAMLEAVGLRDDVLHKYPHELSGGQKQRVAVARALVLRPELLILDEPTSALDVSVQAQILNLFMDLQRSFNLTYLFITHDLKTISHFADDIAVLYLGRIVEEGPVSDVVDHPSHPYTRALLNSVPELGRALLRAPIRGEIPSPLSPPSGCAFRTRCPHAESRCLAPPPYRNEGKKRVLCHAVL
ncbi:ABC transporter ATP-binding protein [uncultured Fretibacterium sp.]|uniref:ABC transporter ATP-binding protein n=1 Tax=uncultured Fretibacterium sp. TaxID=1678694 RepID=UPI00325FD28B